MRMLLSKNRKWLSLSQYLDLPFSHRVCLSLSLPIIRQTLNCTMTLSYDFIIINRLINANFNYSFLTLKNNSNHPCHNRVKRLAQLIYLYSCNHRKLENNFIVVISRENAVIRKTNAVVREGSADQRMIVNL